jgi:hypothetical protein
MPNRTERLQIEGGKAERWRNHTADGVSSGSPKSTEKRTPPTSREGVLDVSLRAKASVVLEALLLGATVKLDGESYVLDDNHALCIPAKKFTLGSKKPPEDCLLAVDMTLQEFLKACEKLTGEDVFLLNASNVLSRERKRRG